LFWYLGRSCFVSRVFCWRESRWPSLRSASTFTGDLSPRAFTCFRDTSAALQMSTAFVKVRSVSRNKGSFKLWFFMAQTILSRIRPSWRVWNSKVAARVRSTVTYWSIVSSSAWSRMLNLCRSYVIFFSGVTVLFEGGPQLLCRSLPS
jgi:hypothetical protein